MLKRPDSDSGAAPEPAQARARWRFGPFELDESRRELTRGQELLILEPKPFNLLMLMLRHPGEVILKNDLIDALWTGRIVVDAVITNCVAKLRTALGEEGAAWIKTVHGFGYRFDCEPELLSDIVQQAAAPSLSLQAGDAIAARPNWQLLRRLGLSGDTWLAQHAKTHALRVFKFASDERGLSALKREVTIFRLLRASLGEKPCYSEVLDWNFDEAPWFLEVEYCAGGSLAEWFDTQGGILNVPLATRLELIARIADALAEVHGIGVLHKDLKPANVLVVPGVDPIPQIRLADFGAGRVLEAGRLAAFEITRMGFTQHIDTQADNSGTPLYLAPELLAGHPATVKADLYALGVMLYQCVAGSLRRPLSAGWELAIDDEMLREDIAAAAEGDPERRLGDAAEFARRIRSIETRRRERETEREHQRKLEREARALERMRARRVGIIAAFAALVVGVIVSAALYVDARKARDHAQAEQARAEKIAVFLGEDMFRELLSYEHPVKDLTAKELLDSASAQVEKRFKDEPDIQARVFESLGRGYMMLDHSPEAARLLDRSLAMRLARPAKLDDESLGLSELLIGLKYALGELPASLDSFEKIYKKGLDERGARDPAVLRLRVALARGRIQLGDWQGGERELSEVLADDGISRWAEPLFILSLHRSLALVQTRLARYDEAKRELEVVSRLAEEKFGRNHLEFAKSRLWLVDTLIQSGDLDKADHELVLIEPILEKWGAEGTAENIGVMLHRARILIGRRKPDLAIDLLKRELAMVASEDATYIDQSYVENRALASAYQLKGDLTKAQSCIRKAYDSAVKSLGFQHPLVFEICMDRAEYSIAVGRIDQAREAYRCNDVDMFSVLPKDHPLLLRKESISKVLAGRLEGSL